MQIKPGQVWEYRNEQGKLFTVYIVKMERGIIGWEGIYDYYETPVDTFKQWLTEDNWQLIEMVDFYFEGRPYRVRAEKVKVNNAVIKLPDGRFVFPTGWIEDKIDGVALVKVVEAEDM